METILGVILWVLANVVYIDMRRRGQRGFKRLVAFWLGWPATLVGMLSVDEKSQPPVRLDDGDLRSLVQEIRRDRMLRGLPDGESPEGREAGDDRPTGETRREEE